MAIRPKGSPRGKCNVPKSSAIASAVDSGLSLESLHIEQEMVLISQLMRRGWHWKNLRNW